MAALKVYGCTLVFALSAQHTILDELATDDRLTHGGSTSFVSNGVNLAGSSEIEQGYLQVSPLISTILPGFLLFFSHIMICYKGVYIIISYKQSLTNIRKYFDIDTFLGIFFDENDRSGAKSLAK